MLQQDKANDYVIATGETHTVREFIKAAFESVDVNIEWSGTGQAEKGVDVRTGKTLVSLDLGFSSVNPSSAGALVRGHTGIRIPLKGDFSKAKEILGWEPKMKYIDLMRIMVEYDLNLIKNEA